MGDLLKSIAELDNHLAELKKEIEISKRDLRHLEGIYSKVNEERSRLIITKDDNGSYAMAGNSTRPPIGIAPFYIWQEQRKSDIEAAILRYVVAEKEVPKGWIAELQTLTAMLKEPNPEGHFS